MAGLIQRPNGTYYAQFDHPIRKRKRFSLKTKRKDIARRRLVKLTTDEERGRFDPWTDDPWTYDQEETRPETISAALEAFLERKRRDGRSENTINSYRWIVGLLADRIGESTPLQEVGTDGLDAFTKDASVSKSSRHTRFRHVRAFLRWCVKEGLLEASPMESVEPPGKAQKLPKAMTY